MNLKGLLISMFLELVVLIPQVLKVPELDGQVLICRWLKFRSLLIGQLQLFMIMILEHLLLLGRGVKILKLIHLG